MGSPRRSGSGAGRWAVGGLAIGQRFSHPRSRNALWLAEFRNARQRSAIVGVGFGERATARGLHPCVALQQPATPRKGQWPRPGLASRRHPYPPNRPPHQDRDRRLQQQGHGMTRFPENFLWGAATAAYQIEGSPLADGAGPGIWQRFSHDPRLMAAKGDTGDVACDHYNRVDEDVDLMRRLGLQAYRFSVAWGRILPEGTGRVNETGLAFYERLVDRLLESGIEPLCTLYHWDLPAALDDRGGWLNRDIADWFADYARILFQRFDGRGKKGVTLNEPWVITDGGYLHGALAPGHRNRFEAPIASHNLLLSHAAAVEAYRAAGKHRIGLVVNIEPKYRASDDPADVA